MLRSRFFFASGALLVVALVSLFSSSAVSRASAHATGCGSWQVVSSPSPDPATNVFDGVAAISKNDAWAVGYQGNQTLTAHWNGTAWSVVPSPNASSQDLLDAVTAVNTHDVWAVGFSGDTLSNNSLTLAEQWNGSSWSIVPTLAPGISSEFSAVSRVPGSTKVWAVGHYTDSTQVDHSLIELWDGIAWTIVASPDKGVSGTDLLGVTALSGNNAWAVGTYADAQGNQKTITEHWNGYKWSVVSSPNVAGTGVLWAAASDSDSNKVWAAGTYFNKQGVAQSLIEYWDGGEWRVVHSPNVPGLNNTFFGIAVNTSSDVWAVGLTYDNNGGNHAFSEHWNGDNWKIISTPDVAGDSILNAVTKAPGSETFWAIGVSYTGSKSNTVTMSFCSK